MATCHELVLYTDELCAGRGDAMSEQLTATFPSHDA
jgi:hypothetical protein